MKKGILNIFILLMAWLLVKNFVAQEQVNAQAFITIDTNAIRIGEQTRLKIIFGYDKSKTTKKLLWPQMSDTLTSHIDVIGKTRVESFDTKKNSSTSQFRQTVTITSFDSGVWVVPPFQFFLEGDTVPIAETNALVIDVKTVRTDTAEASIKDIKPVFDENWDWKVILPYVYWTLAFAILAYALIHLYIILFVRKKVKNHIPLKPKEPPHWIALRELERIRQQKLWTEGKYKDYFTSVTDVLRIYIEGRFRINAMELTTDEILQIFRSQVIDSESKTKLRQVLELADFVKFAKATPLEQECVLCLENAFDFVNGTKREEVIETENGTITTKEGEKS